MGETQSGYIPEQAHMRSIDTVVFPPYVDAYFGSGTKQKIVDLFSTKYVSGYEQYSLDGEFRTPQELNEYVMLDTDTAEQMRQIELVASEMIGAIGEETFRMAVQELDDLVRSGKNGAQSKKTAKLFNSISQIEEVMLKESSTSIFFEQVNLFSQALSSFMCLRLLRTIRENFGDRAGVGLRQLLQYNVKQRRGELGEVYIAGEFVIWIDHYKRFLDQKPARLQVLNVGKDEAGYQELSSRNDILSKDVLDQSVFKTVGKFSEVVEFGGAQLLVEAYDQTAFDVNAPKDTNLVCIFLVTVLVGDKTAIPKTHETSFHAESGSMGLHNVSNKTIYFALTRKNGDIGPFNSPLSIGRIDDFLGLEKSPYQSIRHVCLLSLKKHLDAKEADIESWIMKEKEVVPVSDSDAMVDELGNGGTVQDGDFGDAKDELGGDEYVWHFTPPVRGLVDEPSDSLGDTPIYSSDNLPLPRAISGSEVSSALEKICGAPIRQRGSHAIFSYNGKTQPVPVKGHSAFGVGMLHSILKSLGIPRKEFLEAAGFHRERMRKNV